MSEATETVERILMNKETGDVSLGIVVTFKDKYYKDELMSMPGYSITLQPNDHDGWLIFSGEPDARGPWLFVNKDIVENKCDDLGFL